MKILKKLFKCLPATIQKKLRLRSRQWHHLKKGYKKWRHTGFVSDIERYNVYDEWAICYIDVPKVASTSVKKLMLDVTNRWDNSVENNSLAIRKATHLLTNQYFKTEQFDIEENDYFVFSFVRNPFARLVSVHKNLYLATNKDADQIYDIYAFGLLSRHKGLDKDFKKFAIWVCRIPDAFAERHFISQHAILHTKEGKSKANFVGKMEEMDKAWPQVQQRTGLPALPHHNRTKKYVEEWMDYYDSDLAKRVYERYKEDIEVYGYQKEYRALLDYIAQKGE